MKMESTPERAEESPEVTEPPNKKVATAPRHTTGEQFTSVLQLSGTTLPAYHQVFVGNRGLHQLVSTFYETLRSTIAAPKLALCPVFYLEYCSHIAFLYRIALTAVQNGYSQGIEISQLKRAAEYMEVPDVVADLIDSIGSVVLPSGVKIVPRFQPAEELFGRNLDLELPEGNAFWRTLYINPNRILIENGLRPLEGFGVNFDLISQYMVSKNILSKTGMNFRTINCSTTLGKPAMLISVRSLPDGTVMPVSPQLLLAEDFNLGVIFHFRSEEEISMNIQGHHPHLLKGYVLGAPIQANLARISYITGYRSANM
jgi:hypothetical protein